MAKIQIQSFRYGQYQVRTFRDDVGAGVAVKDVADALGVTNSSYVARGLRDGHDKRTITIPAADGLPSYRMLLASPTGLIDLLTQKRTAAADAMLKWVENDLFPHILTDLDEQPPIIKAALRSVQIADAPWAGIALTYDGQALYEDSETRKLWASQRQIAGVFGCTTQNVSKHLQAIAEEGFLDVMKFMRVELIPLHQGEHEAVHQVVLYGFQAICAVGDRVSSERAAAFRQWRADWLENHLTGQGDRGTLERELADTKRKLTIAHNATPRLQEFFTALELIRKQERLFRPANIAAD